jgi:hypothetical protein
MSGRSTPWRTMPRGEQRFRVGVTSTGRWLVHRKVNWSRAPRIFALSRRSWCRREHTKGPCSRKVSRFASRRLLFTRRRRGGLGLLPRFRAAQPPLNGVWCSVGQAKAAPPRTAGGRRQGHQRFDRAVAVGRKRPRLAGLRFAGSSRIYAPAPIHRSVHRGVKPRSTSGPRKRRRVVPQSPALEIPRTHEMRVFVSTVWMAEVGP